MPVNRPYRRTCRPHTNGSYTEGGKSAYILDSRYAVAPPHYIRAFLMILKDMQALFDFIEPADGNLKCYSYRIHELLVRACIEVEANCRAILTENGYPAAEELVPPRRDWTMKDYKKIEASHRMSRYFIRLPLWNGTRHTRQPFTAWSTGSALPWYDAYNTTKHNRQTAFVEATFEHMTDAVCGLHALLSAQFHTQDFGPADYFVADGPNDGMESGIGEYLRVRFPDNWPISDRYDFDWNVLKEQPEPFQCFDYTTLP